MGGRPASRLRVPVSREQGGAGRALRMAGTQQLLVQRANDQKRTEQQTTALLGAPGEARGPGLQHCLYFPLVPRGIRVGTPRIWGQEAWACTPAAPPHHGAAFHSPLHLQLGVLACDTGEFLPVEFLWGLKGVKQALSTSQGPWESWRLFRNP